MKNKSKYPKEKKKKREEEGEGLKRKDIIGWEKRTRGKRQWKKYDLHVK